MSFAKMAWTKPLKVLLKIVGVRSRRIYFVSYYLIPNPFATYFKPSRIGEFHGPIPVYEWKSSTTAFWSRVRKFMSLVHISVLLTCREQWAKRKAETEFKRRKANKKTIRKQSRTHRGRTEWLTKREREFGEGNSLNLSASAIPCICDSLVDSGLFVGTGRDICLDFVCDFFVFSGLTVLLKTFEFLCIVMLEYEGRVFI